MAIRRMALISSILGLAAGPIAADEPKSAIAHGFLATGAETYIRDADGTISWRYSRSTRDGWVLPSGNVLLAVSKGGDYPGGAAVEVTRDGKIVFEFKGTQSEVNTVQAVDDGRILLTEAGDRPRLLEVDRSGKIVVEVPIKAQTGNHHLQTRMARKLPNGHYLVPQLLDRVVREYSPTGEVVWEAKTPDMPFTAIRLANGNTLVGCTLGNLVVELDPKGEFAWRVTNDDLPGRPIRDACGVQRLPNGNTIVASYAAKGDEPKLLEITPEKKLVWTHRDPKKPGIHHVQILDTGGGPIADRTMR